MVRHRMSAWLIAGFALLLLVGASGITGMAPGVARAASAQIKLSRFMAPPGATATIQGSTFHAGDKVTLSLLYAGVGPDSLRTIATLKDDVGGGGAFSTDFTVPKGTKPGLYTILATDRHGNVALQPIEVPIQLRVVAGKGGPTIYPVPGLAVLLSGAGFNAGERVDLAVTFPQYTGNPVKVTKSATTDSNGAFSAVGIQVPWNTKDGDVPLTVTRASNNGGSAITVTLRVSHRPFVVLTSTKTSPGETLHAQIAGFAPNDKIVVVTTVSRTDAADLRIAKTIQTGNRGMVGVWLYLPKDTRPGSFVVTATVAGTRFHASARYSVTGNTNTAGPTATPPPKATATPSAKLSLQVAPRSVIPGAGAQVLGSGFPANVQVVITTSISRNGAAQQDVRVTAKTNGKGEFVATLHTPGDAAAGTYGVTARAGGRSATDRLHIAYLKTAVVAVPARAIPGTSITVTGVGYASRTTVTVTLDRVTLGTAEAEANGTFKSQFTVPGSTSTGNHTLAGKDSAGRGASFPLLVFRHIATHFYFASLFTGSNFHESLLFANTSATNAVVHITYQRQNGAPIHKTITVPKHSRQTHDVNGDLGGNVTAAASVAADVPIAAERLVMHGGEGSLDPGAPAPDQSWYFANGNTSHGYHEQIAVQNPLNVWTNVTIQVQPTHSKTYWLHGTMHPQSRMSWDLNKSSRDAIGVNVSANHPIVANRTIFIHNGITSKTGVKNPNKHWYFAAGPNQGGTRHWIGVINTTDVPSQMVLTAYNAQGAVVATVKKLLRPYDRQGFLMNRYAGQTEVAVTVSTDQPSIAEQSTFITGSHNAHTDTFGVTSPGKIAEFADATTWGGQKNYLGLFNPNAVAVPIVVQFLNQHGGTTQQTYIVPPYAHSYVDIGKVVPNSQLGVLAVSSYPFVALDRQEANGGAGAMITLGTQS